MPRYYIVVGAPENFQITADRGFTLHGLKSRRRKTAEQLEKGDKILFYLTGIQAWGGIATVMGEAYEDHTPIWSGKKEGEDYPNRFPIAPDLILGVEHSLKVEPMVPDIEYLKKWPAQHWRLGFQGNVHEIGEGDYKTIRKGMEKASKSPAPKAGSKATAKSPAKTAKSHAKDAKATAKSPAKAAKKK